MISAAAAFAQAGALSRWSGMWTPGRTGVEVLTPASRRWCHLGNAYVAPR
jgi:hypothetical protein